MFLLMVELWFLNETGRTAREDSVAERGGSISIFLDVRVVRFVLGVGVVVSFQVVAGNLFLVFQFV